MYDYEIDNIMRSKNYWIDSEIYQVLEIYRMYIERKINYEKEINIKQGIEH